MMVAWIYSNFTNHSKGSLKMGTPILLKQYPITCVQVQFYTVDGVVHHLPVFVYQKKTQFLPNCTKQKPPQILPKNPQ